MILPLQNGQTVGRETVLGIRESIADNDARKPTSALFTCGQRRRDGR
jgi:hypothetical protein